MKVKSFLLISLSSLFLANEAFSAKGLVIKLDVTDNAQDILINTQIRKAAGMAEQKSRHHVTVGYIETQLPDDQMDLLGKTLTEQLESIFNLTEKPVNFTVKHATQPFGQALALVPSDEMPFKIINEMTNNLVLQNNYKLNDLTQSTNYTPHMTLSRNSDGNDTQYLNSLNHAIQTLQAQRNGELFFKLVKFSYTVMK